MFLKLLGEASDDLERVTPRSRESIHIETTRNKHRCSRSETPSETLCCRPETSVQKPCSRPETPSAEICMADPDRWYADVGADSTVTARSFRDLRCET